MSRLPRAAARCSAVLMPRTGRHVCRAVHQRPGHAVVCNNTRCANSEQGSSTALPIQAIDVKRVRTHECPRSPAGHTSPVLMRCPLCRKKRPLPPAPNGAPSRQGHMRQGINSHSRQRRDSIIQDNRGLSSAALSDQRRFRHQRHRRPTYRDEEGVDCLLGAALHRQAQRRPALQQHAQHGAVAEVGGVVQRGQARR